MENQKYTIRVSCMTYNHALYIEDAMNGFCMQKTTFPFICTIIDDDSTDGEQEVIKNYLEVNFNLDDKSVVRRKTTDDYHLIFAQHKTNKNCYFVVLFLKYNHYKIKKLKEPYLNEYMDIKYVALCEGDDYWIVPDKLQQQVDFMEGHPDYSLCCHRIYKFDELQKTRQEDTFLNLFLNKSDFYTFDRNENIRNWYTQTQSVVYRASAKNNDILKQFRYRRDVHLNYVLLSYGKGAILPFLGAVYRRNEKGIYAFTSKYDKGLKGYYICKELYGYFRDKALFRQSIYYYSVFFVNANNREKRIIFNDFYDLTALCFLLAINLYGKFKSLFSK